MNPLATRDIPAAPARPAAAGPAADPARPRGPDPGDGDAARRDATVLVVIVNYRTAGLAIDCLRSLEDEAGALPGLRVEVVDNASGDGSADRLEAAVRDHGWGGWASVRPLPGNGGFAAGNNAAIRPAMAAPDAPDYVLLLNPDTVVRRGGVRALVDFLEGRPGVGLAGSRLEHPDGTPQRSAFRFPSVLGELEDGLRLGVASRCLSRWVVAPPPPERAAPADWVAGASLIVRREVFEAVGLLDEGYFMYYEEVDFCRRAGLAGWPCWYVPESRVVHLVGQSSGVTGAGVSRRRRPAYWFEARRRYFLRHLGRPRTALADSLWAAGRTAHRGRLLIQRRPSPDPVGLVGDFLRHNFLGGLPAPDRRDTPAPAPAPATDPAIVAGSLPPLNRGDRDGNPPGLGLLALLREDLRTHDGNAFEQGFWAVAVHRLGNWRMGIRSKILRAPMTLLYRALGKWVEWTCGITLPYTVGLGRRVRIWHHGGMILHARSIGDDVQIRHNTTFGVARTGDNLAIPTIGDRVDIGCGACILGAVRLGDDSRVGANAVVLSDVPAGATAVGIPARVIPARGAPG